MTILFCLESLISQSAQNHQTQISLLSAEQPLHRCDSVIGESLVVVGLIGANSLETRSVARRFFLSD
ncbi:MAG: hypothetical protein ACPG6K_08700, partial [Pseudohongiellaceae bacterium]